MRIEGFRDELWGNTRRVTANVVWEDCPRAPISVYFEADSRFIRSLDGIPSAYLLAAGIPALFQGERRIRIEGTLDPGLSDGVETALAILQDWYGLGRDPLAIESSGGFEALEPAPDRAALFLTGGVDSLHMLMLNRRNYPPEHVASFRSAISIAGLAFPAAEKSPRSLDVTARQEAAVNRICRLEDLEMIAVRTNMRWIEPDISFTTRAALASCLAAVGHFVSGTVSSASIASGFHIESLAPNGSHPLLDPNFSGTALEIRHEGTSYKRLEKAGTIAPWETAVENMFVCFEGPLRGESRNCGKCEKCLRTMASLLCFDGLERTRSFPIRDITPEMIDRVDLGYHPEFFPYQWTPIGDALRRAGRADLARAVRRKVAAARRYPRWLEDKGIRGFIRRWDRRMLGGTLGSVSRKFRALSSRASGQ